LSKGGVAVEGQAAVETAAAKINGQVSGVGIHLISIHTAHNAHLVVCCKCSSVNEETRSSACFFSFQHVCLKCTKNNGVNCVPPVGYTTPKQTNAQNG